VSLWDRGANLTLLNVGYADLAESYGLYLEDSEERESMDRYRYQLYDKVVARNGREVIEGFENMEGKTLLETGCGRGGGLNFLAKKLKPQYAIGVDMTVS
jgi:tRNA G46 methylase TrmB